MPYPRQLVLDVATEEKLIRYLEDELLNHYAERGDWLNRIIRYQSDYWAEPTTKRATFPFVGASTLTIPLNAIAVEAVHARSMTTLFALDQLVSAQAVSPLFADHARPVERFMNNEMIVEMQARKKLDSSILEIEKFGTGIAKISYERLVRYAVRQIGDTEEEYPVIVRDGAVIDPVALTRFLMPFSAQDAQTAPWCGEEHSRTPYEVLIMEESGFFLPGTFDRLKTWVSTTAITATGVERKAQQEQEKNEERKAVWPNLIDWVELWLGFNVDGAPNGRTKEIVVHYHRPSRTIMSCRYNWHEDLHRPYRVGVYFPVEHRWAGIGLCKMGEQFQKEVTAQHRQRLDNATMANMRMLKISKLSGYQPGEPIFPGKMWFVDDMSHVDSIQMGEIYPSAYNNEQAALMYHERRSGVNDQILGQPASGTPGTATGDLARIQEGTKKFDFVYSNIKTFVKELILDTAVTVRQFGPRRIEYWTQVEGGNYVEQFFQAPVEMIRHELLVSLHAAGQQQNRVLDRQNWTTVATLLQQYYVGMTQLAQMTGNPELIQYITQKGLLAGTEAMKQVLETFEIKNVDRIILNELLQAGSQNGGIGQNNGAAQPVPVGGGNTGPVQAGPISGMDQLAQIISLLGNGAVPPAGNVRQLTAGV